MGMKYALGLLLLVSTCCHLTSDNAHPADDPVFTAAASALRENANKVINNLKGFGNGAASLGLIKYQLTNINKCIDDILSSRQNLQVQNNLLPSDHQVVIANKELGALTEDSSSMDLDFIVMTAPFSLIREIILGVYQIKLSNLDAISKNPEAVISTLAEADAFAAAKNIFLNTPTQDRILC